VKGNWAREILAVRPDAAIALLAAEICWAAMTLRTSSRSSHHAHHLFPSAHPRERVQGVLRAMAGTLIASEDTLGEVLQAHVVVVHGHDQSQVHRFARDHRRLLAALR
jgi:hypothetical protein